MPSHKSILKRGKTTGGFNWSDDDNDDEVGSMAPKRRKTMDIEMRDVQEQNTVQAPPERNVSFLLNGQNYHLENSWQPDRQVNQEPTVINMPPLIPLPSATRELSAAATPAIDQQQADAASLLAQFMTPAPSTNDDTSSLNRPKRSYERSKSASAQATPISQDDMSTGSLKIAARAATIEMPANLSQVSNDSTDELSLPVSALNNTSFRRTVTPNNDLAASLGQQLPAAMGLTGDDTTMQSHDIVFDRPQLEQQLDINTNVPTESNGAEVEIERPKPQPTEVEHMMNATTTMEIEPSNHEDNKTHETNIHQQIDLGQNQQQTHDNISIMNIEPLPPKATSSEKASIEPQTTNPLHEPMNDVPTAPIEQGNTRKTKPLKPSRKSSKAGTKTPEVQDDPNIDEFIGLPKENYKPRPSRSRSKTFEEYMGIDAPPGKPTLESRRSEGRRGSLEDLYDPNESDRDSKVSKAKKKKVKRGKTSSAALLKKRDPSIEDDVIWIDDDDEPAPPKRHEDKKLSPETPGDRACTPPTALLNDPPQPNSNSKFAVVITTPRKRPVNEIDLTKHALEPEPAEPPSPLKPKPRSRKNTKKAEQKEQQDGTKKQDQKRRRTKSTVRAEIQFEETPKITPEPATEAGITEQLPEATPDAHTPHDNTVLEKEAAQSDTGKVISEQEHVDPIKKTVGPERDEKTNGNRSMSHETPKKPELKPPEPRETGPNKHSPIPLNKRVPYRVGLSKKVRVAPLLKVIRK